MCLAGEQTHEWQLEFNVSTEVYQIHLTSEGGDQIMARKPKLGTGERFRHASLGSSEAQRCKESHRR